MTDGVKTKLIWFSSAQKVKATSKHFISDLYVSHFCTCVIFVVLLFSSFLFLFEVQSPGLVPVRTCKSLVFPLVFLLFLGADIDASAASRNTRAHRTARAQPLMDASRARGCGSDLVLASLRSSADKTVMHETST